MMMYKKVSPTNEIIVMGQCNNIHPVVTMRDGHKNTIQICRSENLKGGYELFIRFHATESYGHLIIIPPEVIDELHALRKKDEQEEV